MDHTNRLSKHDKALDEFYVNQIAMLLRQQKESDENIRYWENRRKKLNYEHRAS